MRTSNSFQNKETPATHCGGFDFDHAIQLSPAQKDLVVMPMSLATLPVGCVDAVTRNDGLFYISGEAMVAESADNFVDVLAGMTQAWRVMVLMHGAKESESYDATLARKAHEPVNDDIEIFGTEIRQREMTHHDTIARKGDSLW